jgi:hypothetical protein
MVARDVSRPLQFLDCLIFFPNLMRLGKLLGLTPRNLRYDQEISYLFHTNPIEARNSFEGRDQSFTSCVVGRIRIEQIGFELTTVH